MTYREAYEKAEWKLERGEITIGEFDELTKSLDEEIRPHGEWKEFTVSTYRGTDEWGEPKWGKGKKFICKRCGRRTVIRENFCPNCGADMRKEGESN